MICAKGYPRGDLRRDGSLVAASAGTHAMYAEWPCDTSDARPDAVPPSAVSAYLARLTIHQIAPIFWLMAGTPVRGYSGPPPDEPGPYRQLMRLFNGLPAAFQMGGDMHAIVPLPLARPPHAPTCHAPAPTRQWASPVRDVTTYEHTQYVEADIAQTRDSPTPRPTAASSQFCNALFAVALAAIAWLITHL